jgi:hypothetical protein
MPGKGRRVASRQAELGKKRRRQTRGAGSVTAEGSEAVAVTPGETAVATEVRESSPVVARSQSPVQSRSNAPQANRTPTRARLDRPVAYNYVMPELRRILIMSGTLLGVLIGLSIAVSYLI